ncbi:MAG: YcfL family protein [Sedimentisphaerales bacterium]|nr:YcfL family protein [Sedimentisphaerales bacterium]
MRIALYLLFLLMAIAVTGCKEESSKVNLRAEVKSDSLTNNAVVRPVAYAFSGLIGEGIEVTETITKVNKAGLLTLYVKGVNNSQGTKRFWYKVEWFDKDGLPIESKASVWLPASVKGKSMGKPVPFTLKAVAPRPEAVDFTMETKKWE